MLWKICELLLYFDKKYMGKLNLSSLFFKISIIAFLLNSCKQFHPVIIKSFGICLNIVGNSLPIHMI